MSQMDFTIQGNSQIRKYFEGSDEYLPASEFMYLHEHPMVQESFLREIEIAVNKVTLCLTEKNASGKVVDKFIAHTQNLGVLLSNIDKESTPKILHELREVYNYCNQLLQHYNFK